LSSDEPLRRIPAAASWAPSLLTARAGRGCPSFAGALCGWFDCPRACPNVTLESHPEVTIPRARSFAWRWVIGWIEDRRVEGLRD